MDANFFFVCLTVPKTMLAIPIPSNQALDGSGTVGEPSGCVRNWPESEVNVTPGGNVTVMGSV